jgi:hypothetical protein
VTDVFDNGSAEFFVKFQSSDAFRGVMFPQDPCSIVSTASNDKYFQAAVSKQMDFIKNAKNGG